MCLLKKITGNWKEKAVLRAKELKILRRKYSTLEKSQSKLTETLQKLEDENKYLKKKRVLDSDPPKSKKPKRYGHLVHVIKMVLEIKLQTSSTCRGIKKTLKIVEDNISIEIGSPSHTTVLNWVHKLGLYQLTKSKPKANDWILILDHSIQIGKEKVLVIFGIRESEIDFTKPLQYQNLSPIYQEARESWNGTIIAEILDTQIIPELGRIKYAVADYGSDIKKALKLSKIRHVYDLTHKIATILKKNYRSDERFISFVKQMATARIQCQQTKVAHLIPPALRNKSRFENIGTISNWSNKMLILLKNIPLIEKDNIEMINEKFGWLIGFENLITELSEINETLKIFQKKLKTQGIAPCSILKNLSLLKNLKSKTGKLIKNELENYLKTTIKDIRNKIKPILCSSDIIESAFGKYKNYVSSNPMAGITNLILCISAFTSSLNENELIECMEKYTINDVKKWTKKFIGDSLLKKRKEALSMAN